MNLTTATPAEIDADIARLRFVRADLFAQRDAADKRGDVHEADVILQGAIHIVDDALNAKHAEFDRRGGWSRWYLVEGGHLHSNDSRQHCSRNLHTVQYWMTEHSGRSTESMIEMAGDRVCTVCFPSAPLTPRPATGRFMTITEAERAARAEDKARAAAAKKAAQITTPEGGPVKLGSGIYKSEPKTDRAVWLKAMEAATDLAFWGSDAVDAKVHRAIVAEAVRVLAHSRGVSEKSLRTELNTKIAKKFRREDSTVKATV